MHGYCLPCAYWTDGYRSGAEHCDDFDGLTDAAADAFHASIADEAWEGYTDAGIDDNDLTSAGLTRDDAKARYLDGLRAGLRADARARLARGCIDCGEPIDTANDCPYCPTHRADYRLT